MKVNVLDVLKACIERLVDLCKLAGGMSFVECYEFFLESFSIRSGFQFQVRDYLLAAEIVEHIILLPARAFKCDHVVDPKMRSFGHVGENTGDLAIEPVYFN